MMTPLRLIGALAFVSLSSAVLPWTTVHEETLPRGVDKGHRISTFQSASIKLDVGRVVLTPPKQTPLMMPTEPFVITSLRLQVVRADDGQPVPLSEVYNHHVVFYGGGGKVGADVCGGAHLDMIDGFWGVGAEARGTLTELPDGFAFSGKGPWYANIHLIRSDGVPDVKRCIECHCRAEGGSEDCCPHMSICPGFDHGSAFRNSSDVKEYALQYTVGWSPNVEQYRQVRYMTFDATGCQLEFQVPVQCPWMWRHDNLHGPLPGNKGLRGSGRDLPSDFGVAVRPPSPDCVSRVSWEYELPDGAEGEVVFGKGHVHTGGLNITAQLLRNGSIAPKLLCTSTARYGNAEPYPTPTPGNELGYVVGMSTCRYDVDGERPVLQKGDKIRVEVTYRTDLWFHGVMGLLDLAVAPRQADLNI